MFHFGQITSCIPIILIVFTYAIGLATYTFKSKDINESKEFERKNEIVISKINFEDRTNPTTKVYNTYKNDCKFSIPLLKFLKFRVDYIQLFRFHEITANVIPSVTLTFKTRPPPVS